MPAGWPAIIIELPSGSKSNRIESSALHFPFSCCFCCLISLSIFLFRFFPPLLRLPLFFSFRVLFRERKRFPIIWLPLCSVRGHRIPAEVCVTRGLQAGRAGSGGELCAWVPTTNSQRMRKLVVVAVAVAVAVGMRMRMRLLSDHLVEALLCPLQRCPPPPQPAPSPSPSASTPSFVWLALSASPAAPPHPPPSSLLYPVIFPLPAWVFRFLARAALRRLCLTLLYCLLLLLLLLFCRVPVAAVVAFC